MATAKSKVDGKRQKTGGRQKGTPNRTTALLKDAILKAAQKAGGDGDDGLENYLQTQATANPTAFLSLLGKVLPYQVNVGGGDDGNPTAIKVNIVDTRA